jgi:L-ascorbate metabolism protein UlaG (beta-lactamase superfamily)
LGQHSFILKIAGQVLYIDPFLTSMETRLVPAMFTPEQAVNADLFFGSHDHADHIDRPVWPQLSKASANAKFIVPELLREGLIKDLSIDASRMIGMDDGQSMEHNGIRISALASAHEFLDRDQVTGRYPYLGFVIEANGLTVYHSGDTCIYEGLITKLRKWDRFDLMMLPINGRDADKLRRNIVGNMTYQEAVDLAGTLTTRYVVPTHYDMFKGNLANVDDFCDYLQMKYPTVESIVPGYGQKIVIA